MIKLCRDNDKPEDWTFSLSDEDLDAHAEKWVQINQILKVDCSKYGIEYIDTSKDRDKILKNILEQISREIV